MTDSGKVLIMAGGTGGHVFPALAVARELAGRGVGIDWLGTSAGIEAELVPASGFTLHTIDVTGVRGKGPLTRLAAPFQVVRSVLQALATVRKIHPDSVIGLGGYASGPGGIAAWLLRIPLVIHEQNAVAGTTNRILARFARRILQAFPGAFEQGDVVGNPVREEIAALPAPAERGVGRHSPLRLLVLGGSLGALAINQLVPAALAGLKTVGASPARDNSPPPSRVQGTLPQGSSVVGAGPAGEATRLPFAVRHQCGRQHLEITRQAYADAGVEASIEPFIDDMAAAYGWADFVICRAGALTVSELAAAGVGALLIPFPAAIDDHQTVNGRWLVNGGGAILIQQRELDPKRLAGELRKLAKDPERMAAMAAGARKLAITDAARRVADQCLEVAA